MKNLFRITCFCVLTIFGLAACNKSEDDVTPLRTTSNVVLRDDLIYGAGSQSVSLNVLDNDSVPAGGILTFSTPPGGTITSNGSGFIFNAPAQGIMDGFVIFNYTYCINNTCDSAAVYILIGKSCNSILTADYVSTPVNQAIDIPVLANDVLCGQPRAILLTGKGKAVFLPNNILRYTPDTNFSGIDTLAYTINTSENVRAKVWIQVGQSNCNLKANDDFRPVYQDSSLPPYPHGISPLRNDWYCKSVTLEVVSAPAHGSVLKYPTNPDFLYYIPNAGYLGPDSFQYKICTATGECSVATFNLNVFQ